MQRSLESECHWASARRLMKRRNQRPASHWSLLQNKKQQSLAASAVPLISSPRIVTYLASFRKSIPMQIWIDADACPVEAKEILYKVSKRLQIHLNFVANQMMYVPKSDLIHFELVKAGADVADRRIVELLSAGDLVISADIPLAANAVARGATVLDPRGEELNADNVGSRLAARNLMDELRGTGLETGGPAPYSARNKQDFANQLDRLLTKLRRS